jgi:hypothetical protein
MGQEVEFDRYVKAFTFDAAGVPAAKNVDFEDLKVSLHADGRRITMKVSNSKRGAVTGVSLDETEIYLQLEDVAIGICIREDRTKGAISPDPRD